MDGLLTKAADVYSFGVVVWEMFSGQRPYSGLTHGQILHAITTGKPLPLGASCPQVGSMRYREFFSRVLHPDLYLPPASPIPHPNSLSPFLPPLLTSTSFPGPVPPTHSPCASSSPACCTPTTRSDRRSRTS